MSLYVPVLSQQKIGVRKTDQALKINFFLKNSVDVIDNINIRFKNIESGEIIDSVSLDKAEIIPIDSGLSGLYYVQITDSSGLLSALKEFKSCQVQIQLQQSANVSNWSSASVINFIDAPECIVYGARSLNNVEAYILGGLIFYSSLDPKEISNQENDSLECYQISLQDAQSSVIEKSDYIMPSSRNEIRYKVKYPVSETENYTVTINYQTRKGYVGSKNDSISFEGATEGNLITLANCQATLNENLIRITHSLEGLLDYVKTATLYLERASSVDYYNSWETIGARTISIAEQADYTSGELLLWEDRILSLGVSYKYRIKAKYIDEETMYISKSNETSPIIYFAEDILLSSADKTLKIRYNPKISNFKYNITDTVTSTLGGAYPFVRRNGNTKYKSFSLSGLIYSDGMTTDTNFISMYGNLNLQVSDPVMLEAIQEKMFRDLLIDFFQEDKVKIFRSLTEGSMLIKLSNISLNPEDKLGRRIWSFTANATEVAEYSVENLEKYGFSPVGFDANTEQFQFGDFVIYVTNYSEADKAITVNESAVDTANDALNVAIAMRP